MESSYNRGIRGESPCSARREDRRGSRGLCEDWPTCCVFAHRSAIGYRPKRSRLPSGGSRLLPFPHDDEQAAIGRGGEIARPILPWRLRAAQLKRVAVETVNSLAHLRRVGAVGEKHVDFLGVLARIKFESRLVSFVLYLDEVLVVLNDESGIFPLLFRDLLAIDLQLRHHPGPLQLLEILRGGVRGWLRGEEHSAPDEGQ